MLANVTSLRLLIVAFLLFTPVLGLQWRRRLSPVSPLDSLLVTLAPTVVAIVVVCLLGTMLQGALFYWNPPRLVTSVAFVHGYRLYYPADSGPVLNTIYSPVWSLAYIPAALAHTTLGVTLTAGVIGVCFFFGTALAGLTVFARLNGAGRLRLLYSCCFFTVLSLTSYSLNGSAFFQPVDPIALGLANVACVCIGASIQGSRKPWLVTVSAGAAVLSVWTKQTMAPLVVALPVFVWFAVGRGAALRYVANLALLGVCFSATFVLAFGAKDMAFNMFVLASHHPFRSDAYPFIYFVTMLHDCREWLLSALVLGAAVAVALRASPEGGLRRLLSNPWTMYLWVGACNLPTSYLGFMKEGGRDNSMSAHTYFLVMACSLCLLGRGSFPMLADGDDSGAEMRRRIVRAALFTGVAAFGGFVLLSPATGNPLRATLLWLGTWLLTLGVAISIQEHGSAADAVDATAKVTALALTLLFGIDAMPFAISQLEIPAKTTRGPVVGAYAFAQQHPHEVLFPYDPLSTLLTDGELYHFDYGLFDRRLAGFPISAEHYRAHIPSHLRYVIYPRWVAAADSPRESLRYLTEFTQLVRPRGLEEWDVYMRPEDAADP